MHTEKVPEASANFETVAVLNLGLPVRFSLLLFVFIVSLFSLLAFVSELLEVGDKVIVVVMARLLLHIGIREDLGDERGEERRGKGTKRGGQFFGESLWWRVWRREEKRGRGSVKSYVVAA